MKRKLLLMTLIGIFVFILTGCSITIGDTPAQTQNPADNQKASAAQNTSPNNNQNTQSNNQNQTNNSNQGSSDFGVEKTAGKFTIQVNGVREYPGNDVDQPKNGTYVIVDCAVTNNSDESDTIYSDDVTLTDANGKTFKAMWDPNGVTDLNFVVTSLPGQSKAPRGVFVFDASTDGPYTMTFAPYGATPVSWKISTQ